MAKKKLSKKKRRRRLIRRLILLTLLLAFVTTLAIFSPKIVKIIKLAQEAKELVNKSSLDTFMASGTTVIYDTDGNELCTMRESKDMYYVDIGQIPDTLQKSFVVMEDVLAVGEGYIKRVFKDILGVDVSLPIKRLTYTDAMNRYGSDKPDTRFGMELYDLTDTVKNCGFGVFTGAIEGGGSVRGITAKGAVKTLTRKEIDKLTDMVRGIGAKGLAWVRLNEDGSVASSFAKFLTEDEMKALLQKADAQAGDVVLIIGDTKNSVVLPVLGALRCEVAKKLDIIPKDRYDFLWITEFPFFDWDEDAHQFVAMHHPFTAPMDEYLDTLESDKANVKAKAYDLVLNGVELCSGSIRITNPDLQKRMFALLGLSDEEAYAKFGFLTDAFKYGAPPHGGMGIGLDRLIMQMLGCESLRDVIAFPKVQNASEPMTECPAEVDEIQLDELGIKVK